MADEMQIAPIRALGDRFVPAEFLPDGQDEFYLRNEQCGDLAERVRPLRADEIEVLVRNGNSADSWERILVGDEFDPQHVKNCEFYGLVRIGRLERVYLEYHDMHVPVGLTNSRIIACDIDDDCAIHNVPYLAHTIVGRNVILLNIDEMHTTNHAKFGNGIVKDGEDEGIRVWMDLINEAGGRSVMPFDGMTPGDAYLWAKYRDDRALLERLGEITQKAFDARRGFYGTVGERCVIKNCRIIKDVKIGPHAYIKGANKLKNLTIHSSLAESTQIGEGVEMVNGIVGLGCHVFYGCKAVRFIMGNNTNLKYGARLVHSYLGDNSTISCCEVLNNLIFPCHEQHHNNSFLIASLVLGQSNMAANATVGSNHSSRASDGEIRAGRGFWPGLCVSLKHNCRFASFTLLVKGDYPAELNIPLPFSLVSDDVTNGRLVVMPGYWWNYNMYALVRNAWKFAARDTRKTKVQKIEPDYLAPDTVEEMFAAMDLLAEWTGKAAGKSAAVGHELLRGPADAVEGLEVLGEGMERGRRKVVIAKPQAGYAAYRRMLQYYAVKNMLAWMEANEQADFEAMVKALAGPRKTQWVNLGGQLVLSDDLERIKTDIKTGTLDGWGAIHEQYDRPWAAYPLEKQKHACATLLTLMGAETLTKDAWAAALDEVVVTQKYIAEQTYLTRKKDYTDPFRRITFDSDAEMTAVLGTAEDNDFVKQVADEAEAFAALAGSVKSRG